MEWPQVYRLPGIPRSISWEDVNRVLAAVDRRTEAVKRDYAILLLLVTYGLRGREVAALTLDNIDWKRDRLAVPERKAGHSTAFPCRPLWARPLRITSGMAVRQPATGICSSARWPSSACTSPARCTNHARFARSRTGEARPGRVEAWAAALGPRVLSERAEELS